MIDAKPWIVIPTLGECLLDQPVTMLATCMPVAFKATLWQDGELALIRYQCPACDWLAPGFNRQLRSVPDAIIKDLTQHACVLAVQLRRMG